MKFICRRSQISLKMFWDLIAIDQQHEVILFGNEAASKEELFNSIQIVRSTCRDDRYYSRFRDLNHYYFHFIDDTGRLLGKSKKYLNKEEMETEISKIKDRASAAGVNISDDTTGNNNI